MRLFLILLILFGAVGISMALSYGTPNGMAAQAMASNMDYARKDGKKVPQTWLEMDALFGRPMDEALPVVTPTRRYAFITNDVRIDDGRILLIMRSPFREERLYTAWYGGTAHGIREKGRWVIFQDAKSEIHARYIAEEIVTNTFARAGVSLPTPDGLGEWSHERKYREGRNLKIITSCVVLIWAVGIVMVYRASRARRALL